MSRNTLRVLALFYWLTHDMVASQDACDDDSSTTNPLGQCECEHQIFIDGDCTSAFYCSGAIPEIDDGEEYDPDTNLGCLLECSPLQVITKQLLPAVRSF